MTAAPRSSQAQRSSWPDACLRFSVMRRLRPRRRPLPHTGALARRLFVGTSGFSYPHWRGVFYPPGLRHADELAYYRARFDALELNTTFYRLPSPDAVRHWDEALAGATVVMKGPRLITHLHKLVHCEDAEAVFFERVRPLRALKVVLWQLPPMLHRNVGRLDAFLGRLPRTVRHAVEFRHESWWDDSVAKVLKAHDAAFVAVSIAGLPDTLVPTGDLLYLRFHGLGAIPYAWSYSRAELSKWARRVKPVSKGRAVLAFFNNDLFALAPRDAARFRALLLKG